MRNTHRLSLALAAGLLSLGLLAADAATTATVSRPKVDVHRGPDFKTPAVATLAKDASVTVAGQQGLWFKVKTADGKIGYVRVNDVRMAYAKAGNDGGNALFTGKAHLTDSVEAHMGPGLPLVGSGEPIATARRELQGRDAILVVDAGKPVGVLTRADFLGFLAD